MVTGKDSNPIADASAQDHVVFVSVSEYCGPDRPLTFPSPREVVGAQERHAALQALARKEEEHRAAMHQEAEMNDELRRVAEGGRLAEWRKAVEDAGYGATR